MTPMHADILNLSATWPADAQHRLLEMRAIFQDVARAAETGPLDESLKWGQPAWRPRKARMGSTLRLNWSADAPDQIAAFVDCKTDLAAQMDTRFPGQFRNDGRRSLAFDLSSGLHADAIWQLAHLTFTYHRAKRAA